MKPIIVDLDGSLIHTDMLHESALNVFKDKPYLTLAIPFWLLRGKAHLKQKLAQITTFNPELLPYNQDLIEWLKQQRNNGRKLTLCTASDQSIANPIAEHLRIFDQVMASNGSINLAGIYKAQALVQQFGPKGFDYVGNSKADFAVWKQANYGIVVSSNPQFISKASLYCEIDRQFQQPTPNLKAWRKMLRIHQWLKNLLLFIPIFAAHNLTDSNTWISLILAFFAFSICASSVYIANDLLDLESDRMHPRKCHRPFASGKMPIWIGVCLAPILLSISIILGLHINDNFLLWLTAYFGLTCIYSWLLKRIMLLDCLTLAMLYTLRIIAGAAAANMPLSFWLLAFSIFLFLSLAFVKRYAELELQLLSGKQKIHGRGYYTTDAPLIQTLGITAGYASVLVLALYLNSEAVLKLYQTPEWVWAAVPIMLFWISWIWMQAHRGKMHDDPVIFAIKDPTSIITGAAFALSLILGAIIKP